MRWKSWGWALLTGLSLLSSGCNGPKDSCEGTIDSFAGCINGQDWECFPPLIWADHRKKFPDRVIQAWANQEYLGDKHFKWTKVDAAVSGDVCIVRTLASWTWKIRGKNPEDHTDEYSSYTLHRQADGNWYIEIPGASKLGSY
jgi:hypothetical protein